MCVCLPELAWTPGPQLLQTETYWTLRPLKRALCSPRRRQRSRLVSRITSDWVGGGWGVVTATAGLWRRRVGCVRHLLVSLHLPDEGALVEERLQPLLGVVVAELLEGGAPLLLGQPGVLEARRVHDEQRAERVLAGLQGSAGHRDASGRRLNKPPSFSG